MRVGGGSGSATCHPRRRWVAGALRQETAVQGATVATSLALVALPWEF